MYNELRKRVMSAKSVDSPMLKAELLIGRKKLAPVKPIRRVTKGGKMLAGPMATGMGAGMAKGMTKAVNPKPMAKTKKITGSYLPAKPGIVGAGAVSSMVGKGARKPVSPQERVAKKGMGMTPPPPMARQLARAKDSKPVFPKPPSKPLKERTLIKSVDMGVQKGLKNFRSR